MAKSVKQLAQENKIAYINACNAVIGRGGSVPNGMPAIDLAGAITNLPHDYTLAYQKVLRTDSKLKVPSNAESVAFLQKIGGMTEKSNNLIPYPYRDGMSKVQNGITFTVNEDGSVTVNGTATADSYFDFYPTWSDFYLAAGNYYFSGCASGGSGSSYRINIAFKNAEGNKLFDAIETGSGLSISLAEPATQLYCRLAIKANKEVKNLVFKPMFNSGATALPFEKRFEGLRPNKVTSIVSKGANLAYFRGWSANLPRTKETNLTLSSVYGTSINTTEAVESITVTQSMYSDSNSLNHYANGFFIYALKDNLVPEKKYRISFDIEILANPLSSQQISVMPNGKGIRQIHFDPSFTKGRLSEVITFSVDVNYPDARFIEFRNAGMSLEISNVMITEEAVTDITYKPLRDPIPTNIPETVRNLDGYGEGINADYYNYVEWRDGRCYFVQKVKEVDMSSLSLELVSNDDIKTKFLTLITDLYITTSITEIPLLLCARYRAVKQQGIWQVGDMSQGANSVKVSFCEAPNTTLEEFKEIIKGVKLVYALAEPIETDITDLMSGDNSILVEGGGTIELINEHGYDVPSTITYIAEIGGQSGGEGSIVIPDGYIEPSGTLEITENGIHDVSAFANAEVNVPIPSGYIVPSGTLPITTNGEVDVTGYAKANVNVPIPDGYIVPSGSLTIIDNGTYDVKEKASVTVNVPKGEIVEYYDGSYEVT